MENSKNDSRVRYKGRFIKEKIKKHKIAVQATGKENKGRKVDMPKVDLSSKLDTSGPSEAPEPAKCDNRIINLTLLGTELQCDFCQSILSLQDVEKETRRGLGIFLSVRCRDCLLVKSIPTSKIIPDEESNRTSFEVNYKVAFGEYSIFIL